jgi:asparaginyl-tRNA synthetase
MEREDMAFRAREFACADIPAYDPIRHYLDLTNSAYYRSLLTLRHFVKAATDHYFGGIQSMKNIDLFMLTPSVSSPTGPGSDSQPARIRLGDIDTFVTDSAQFGFEPLLLNALGNMYSYLPSIRAEDSDSRHLTQFYHCEVEVAGSLDELIAIAEGYFRTLAETFLKIPAIVRCCSRRDAATRDVLLRLQAAPHFPQITFDDAVKTLTQGGGANPASEYVCTHDNGRDLTAAGEIELTKRLGATLPVWVRNYDRDRVAFYHKPDPMNANKVINADLICAPIIGPSFGGEIIGAGQRQDLANELYDSMARQQLQREPYEWYVNLRRLPDYRPSSGFGMGIERFLSWTLGLPDVKLAIPYPRLKNVMSYP